MVAATVSDVVLSYNRADVDAVAAFPGRAVGSWQHREVQLTF